MKKILWILIIFSVLCPSGVEADPAVFLNAFGETATAYLNDCFLLLGTTADGFVADIIQKGTALEIVTNVQKRVRIIRAKLKAVAQSRIADVDKRLIGLLDQAYACMDHQAWALIQYLQERSPETAKRFEAQRTDCLERLERVSEFYATLPPPPEVAEPLSTR